ncbi:MAG TPA: trypsin-like peptidase domain-containing protein [Brevundimonas sp.]
MKKIARPSVASLFIEMKFGDQLLATGTAFVAKSIHGQLLFTNRHNVTGRNQYTGQPMSKMGGIPDRIIIHHNRANALGQWVQREELLYEQDKPRWIEHPTLKESGDLVGLPLTSLDDVDIHGFDLTEPDRGLLVGPGDVVSVIGFPFGMGVEGNLAIWATGFVASEPDADYEKQPVFLIDCRSRQGQSGSAVVAYRSGGMVAMASGGSAAFDGPVEQLMGIYSGRVNAESDLGRVWKVSAIKGILDTLASPSFGSPTLALNLTLAASKI